MERAGAQPACWCAWLAWRSPAAGSRAHPSAVDQLPVGATASFRARVQQFCRPRVRSAISLCSFPCVAKSFAGANFVAISTLECLFFLAIAACFPCSPTFAGASCRTVASADVMARWTPFYRSLGARDRYHAAGDMVEVRTPDGRCKRGVSTTTNAASSLLGELARERKIPASPLSSILPPPPAQLGPQPFCLPCQARNSRARTSRARRSGGSERATRRRPLASGSR
jgi:hypothetical protein